MSCFAEHDHDSVETHSEPVPRAQLVLHTPGSAALVSALFSQPTAQDDALLCESQTPNMKNT